MAESLEALVQSTSRIATLPDFFHRIEQAASDPKRSIEDIGNIIQEDPGLTARLLRIANSALFALAQPVSTITRALTMVGTRQVRDLALAVSVVNMFKGGEKSGMDPGRFWQHSVYCGLAARVIATYLREKNVETYYVAGLLHDIGRLVLFQSRGEIMSQVMDKCAAEHLLLHRTEKAHFGFDHAELGGALLKEWKLPQELSQPVRWHHNPMQAGDDARGAAIIHLADMIANVRAVGTSGERFVPPLIPQAWDLLALPVSRLEDIFYQVDRQFEEASQVFKPDPQTVQSNRAGSNGKAKSTASKTANKPARRPLPGSFRKSRLR